MEHLDPQMAQRVWQRVQNTSQEDPLPGMLSLIHSCAAGCARLSKHYRGQEGELLRLRTQLLRQAACLQGIRYLRTGQRLPIPATSPTQETPEPLLRRCIGQHLRLAAALRAEANDPEYGLVFADMAQALTSHIQLLLELAGKS